MKERPYEEGSWFAVPLRDGGFGLGVVGRMNPSGVVLGYFFGPKVQTLPDAESFVSLRPSDAVMVVRFGDLGLIRGKWPIVGRPEGWDRKSWPVPEFARCEELSGRCYRVVYSDDDPNEVLREELVRPDVAAKLPRDSMLGAGAAEIRLTRALSNVA